MTTLYVDTTARYQNAATSDLCARILVENGAPVIYRPISQSIVPTVSTWPEAHFATADIRSADQLDAIETVETLSAEFFMARDIIFNLPLCEGSIPVSFKSWIDIISLADFDLSTDCAGGFREKKATVVVASGGLKTGSELDTLTPQLISLLEFIGVEDVEIISADQTSPSGHHQSHWNGAPIMMAA